MLTFFVKGIPKAQPRPRAMARRIGNVVTARVYDAKTAEGWKAAIAIAAREHLPEKPLTTPLKLDVLFILPRPHGHYGTGKNAGVQKAFAPLFHVSKPDLDNLVKAVKDALTTIGMWKDDCQVVQCKTEKIWGDEGGARIQISEVAS